MDWNDPLDINRKDKTPNSMEEIQKGTQERKHSFLPEIIKVD